MIEKTNMLRYSKFDNIKLDIRFCLIIKYGETVLEDSYTGRALSSAQCVVSPLDLCTVSLCEKGFSPFSTLPGVSRSKIPRSTAKSSDYT